MTRTSEPVVFLGPTLHSSEAKRLASARFLPPAAMGDVCRVVADQPSAIVIIDGYFEDKPSVWHKEIMWALDEGIPVIGASSMGALRAAELHTFGMHGFGTVFQQFQTGALTDDDEVAVSHAPAELGWLAISDAMVDIRLAAERARIAGVIHDNECGAIIHHAKSQHFKDRRLTSVFSAVLGEGFDRGAKQWLAHSGPGAKERDCRNLLTELDSVIAQARDTRASRHGFVPTVYMDRLIPFGFPPH